ncbi:serine/threonine-protein kinase 32A [Platysternon megacephalum]|uniref:Serine/threonine-protein kinase 32A n=1 Tax=Platysternon megacephalum TaxID=55544 RepID=A0A4D9F0T0_9SAUR|nr:serine/threonine-protein kinase 32A [Platysternon megacephalum]
MVTEAEHSPAPGQCGSMFLTCLFWAVTNRHRSSPKSIDLFSVISQIFVYQIIQFTIFQLSSLISLLKDSCYDKINAYSLLATTAPPHLRGKNRSTVTSCTKVLTRLQ